jgi:hypothetical protein
VNRPWSHDAACIMDCFAPCRRAPFHRSSQENVLWYHVVLLCCCYYALNHNWSDCVPNSTLYNGLEFDSIRLLLEKQLSFAGHCIRSNQPISELLLLWDHTKLVNCKCCKGVSNANYPRQLLKAIGRVDGLVTTDEEVRMLTLLGKGSLLGEARSR